MPESRACKTYCKYCEENIKNLLESPLIDYQPDLVIETYIRYIEKTPSYVINKQDGTPDYETMNKLVDLMVEFRDRYLVIVGHHGIQ